jgi:WD40 repeat protein
MALSPAPVGDGQRILAVAGYGVESTRGEIGLFRFPGRNTFPTGDVAAPLPSGNPSDREPQGHLNSVLSLAFDPRGDYLASGSSDTTARIWHLPRRRTVAVLRGHTRAIQALAYSPDGRRLLTAGADGLVVLWDVDRRAILATARPDPRRQRPNDPAGDAINALAISPDGRWVVIGRENGDLVRYDAGTLRNAALLPKGAPGQGAVEALAISHDGSKLVASVVSHALRQPSERPRVECDVELRAMPGGAVQAPIARASNLVSAVAFSPDDRRLAFGGGDEQSITLVDLGQPGRNRLELAGQGSSIWDVGFSRDSRVIGFARRRPDLPDPPRQYEDFDLRGQRVAPFDRGELSRALAALDGWSVRPIDPWAVDVLNAQGRGFRLRLDPNLERRWWSYSFVPSGPGHARPTLAVGCEAGVLFFRLDDGRKTRLFAGHHGPVYALAPSPDGKWLVTGSSDQTVRFWRLAGCDALAPLGARFAPADQGRGLGRVESVEKSSFAEAMGMQAGDLVQKLFIGGKERTELKELEDVPPNTMIEFLVLRQGRSVPLGTTRRDAPALTLFPALDHEWIVWTPRGYYETSALGDRKYLGWHRNRARPEDPTDFFAFDHFEQELRRPAALIRWLETADRAVLDPAAIAAPEPEQVMAETRLPLVQVLAPERPAFDPVIVRGAGLPVRVRAASEDADAGRGLIRAVRVLVDGGKAVEIAINPPQAEVNRQVALQLNPGRHRISVVADNDRGRSRTERFDVITEEPPHPPEVAGPAPEPPQLVVLAVGAGEFAGHTLILPRIPFADEDARDVAAFLGDPFGTPKYSRVQVEPIVGRDATAARVLAALDRLDQRRAKGELGQGDSVFVLIESHFLRFDDRGVILASDAAPGTPPAPSVPAALVADALGRLADYGCKVLLLVDGLHEDRPAPPQTNRPLIEWSRALYRKNVITFVASIHGPSRRVASRAHGAFAQGILDSLKVQGRSRLADDPRKAFTLFDFQDAVTRNVHALTNIRQHARCYIPETIPSQTPIFEPPARVQTKALRASAD